MRKYIRYYVPGGTYFFTLVTEKRIPYFQVEANDKALMDIIKNVQASKPFELLAFCFIPDHIHLLTKLPEEDSDFSYRMREIKRLSTLLLRKKTNNPRLKVWQDRFWEHHIRDKRDLINHFDYIHYNPVKHGVTESFDGWKWSSYLKYYDSGFYENKPLDPGGFANSKIRFGE